MAYSDYGGYAYRNGSRVVNRSDCTITPEGDTYGTPGSYPGFALIAAGVAIDEVRSRAEWPSGHAVLGDGPIYAVMHKQSSVTLYRGNERLDCVDLLQSDDPEAIQTSEWEGKTSRYINADHFRSERKPYRLAVDGWVLDVRLTDNNEEDNYYAYARLTQPDGAVWTGFSGYGVGAGLEDAGYGYSTDAREEMLSGIDWPETATA